MEGWEQEYGSELSAGVLVTEDLVGVAEGQWGERMAELGERYWKRSLKIGEKGEVMRVVLVQTPDCEARNRLLVVIHHLVVDGVSWRILLEDLEILLSSVKAGKEADLGKKTSSYRQWHAALEQYGRSRKVIVAAIVLGRDSRTIPWGLPGGQGI